MSKTLELDGMSKDDLIALKEEIDHRLKGSRFWDTIEGLYSIENQINKLIKKSEKILHTCQQLKKLDELGFSIVIYSLDEKKVGFINHSIPKINACFYGFDIEDNKIFNSSKTRQRLTDEDIASISAIFEQEVHLS